MNENLCRPGPAVAVAAGRACCLALILSASAAGLGAGEVGRPSTPAPQATFGTPAEGGLSARAVPWGWQWNVFRGQVSRTRAIQVTAVCMALGLFILMRKWAPPGPGRPAGRP